jgi:hypothetical protein
MFINRMFILGVLMVSGVTANTPAEKSQPLQEASIEEECDYGSISSRVIDGEGEDDVLDAVAGLNPETTSPQFVDIM